jgi:hypothetical protein
VLDLYRVLEIALAIEHTAQPAGGLSSEWRIMVWILVEWVSPRCSQCHLQNFTSGWRVRPQWDWPHAEGEQWPTLQCNKIQHPQQS